MSMSMSDSSSASGDDRTFRQITRDRLLCEMLRFPTTTGQSRSQWKVLIVDKLTVKIMSNACKMADVNEEGISLVEDIYKRRQPLPTMDAIYFIQPTKENVIMFMSDMSGKSSLYKKAYVFFSSRISRNLANIIKKEPTVLPRIGALREMNLEYFAVDSQGFLTENLRALEELFGDEDNHCEGDVCLNVMATRIATVFASLREFPIIHYRSACLKSSTNTMVKYSDVVPTNLAANVLNCLEQYKTIPKSSQDEPCHLLILDRSVDPIAPIIHEWTYGAMCYDLLNLEGNKYVHEVPIKDGGFEKKEVLLDEHDPIWVELRDAHIADASERLHEKMTHFLAKNRAAQIQHGSRDGAEISARDMQRLVQALPQYSEQIDKLSLHVEIAEKINKIIKERGLMELGKLEQDLVFGDAGTKEVINFLRTKEDISREDKLRLMMIYASVYPEKFAGDKGSKLMQLARLSSDDMIAVRNMRLFEGQSEAKKSSTGVLSLKFNMHKKNNSARKERKGEESAWQLSRFYPIIEDLIEKLSNGELPKDEYPCLNDPRGTPDGTTDVSAQNSEASVGRSVRTRRQSWARPRNSEDGYSSESLPRHQSSDNRRTGSRIFVFIVGGATRSELKVCHKLSEKLKREIILGSSSIDDPRHFITKLKMLSGDDLDDVSLDDIQI